MKKNFKKHIGYYIAFALLQLLGLSLVVITSGNRQLQFAAIFLTTFFYFIFAIVHHMLDHDLTSKIVIEYALFGSLGLAVSLMIFK